MPRPQRKRGRPKKKLLPNVVELNRVAEKIGIVSLSELIIDLDAPVEISINQSNEKDSFQISLTLGDKTFAGSGATLLEALQSTPVPLKIVSKGLLKITDGIRKLEKSLMPRLIKRLFYPSAQIYQAKMLEYLMK